MQKRILTRSLKIKSHVEMLVVILHARIEQISKYFRDDDSLVAYCQRKQLQTYKREPC